MQQFLYRCPIIDYGFEDIPPGFTAARGPSIAPVINRYRESHRDIEGHPGASWGAVTETDGYMGCRVTINVDADVPVLLEKLDAVATRVD